MGELSKAISLEVGDRHLTHLREVLKDIQETPIAFRMAKSWDLAETLEALLKDCTNATDNQIENSCSLFLAAFGNGLTDHSCRIIHEPGDVPLV